MAGGIYCFIGIMILSNFHHSQSQFSFPLWVNGQWLPLQGNTYTEPQLALLVLVTRLELVWVIGPADFLATPCCRGRISALQSGLYLCHIFRLSRLVYSLYTFINNRLFIAFHLLQLLVPLASALNTSNTYPQAWLRSTYYLTQLGVLLAIRRISQLLLFEFPQMHSLLMSCQ